MRDAGNDDPAEAAMTTMRRRGHNEVPVDGAIAEIVAAVEARVQV
jgi:hypothetical protein